MPVGCGDLLAGSCPVSFPCLFSVTQLGNGVCEKQAQNEKVNCLLVPPGADQMVGVGDRVRSWLVPRQGNGAVKSDRFRSLACLSMEVQLGNKARCYSSEQNCSRWERVWASYMARRVRQTWIIYSVLFNSLLLLAWKSRHKLFAFPKSLPQLGELEQWLHCIQMHLWSICIFSYFWEVPGQLWDSTISPLISLFQGRPGNCKVTDAGLWKCWMNLAAAALFTQKAGTQTAGQCTVRRNKMQALCSSYNQDQACCLNKF